MVTGIPDGNRPVGFKCRGRVDAGDFPRGGRSEVGSRPTERRFHAQPLMSDPDIESVT